MASDGCDVACVESADECVLRASDHDGDGSPSAACAAEPGDDCNDAEASAYPGADETCDGLDNDCDGLTDLTDGLALSGQNTSLPGSARIDLAWSPALDGFGLALGSIFESEYSLKYATLSQDGRLGEPVRLLSGAALNTPRIAWNGEEFGILSREAACSSEDDTCRSSRAILEIAADGQPMRLSDFGTGSEYISDFGNIGGEWAFALVASGIVYVGRIDPVTSSMALSPPLNTVGSTALDAHLAFDATRPAAAWREGASLIHWAPLSQALEPTGSYQIPTAESGALAFGVTVEGYAFAWTTEGGIAFQRSSSGGQAACDPTFVPFGDPLSLGASVALSDSPKGTLVLAVDSGRSQLHLFRFGADCELIDETSVITEASAIVNPVIAVGEGAVALAWSATQDSAETAFYRVLSDDLCDGTRAQLR